MKATGDVMRDLPVTRRDRVTWGADRRSDHRTPRARASGRKAASLAGAIPKKAATLPASSLPPRGLWSSVLTTHRNIWHQQSLTNRRIAIVVLGDGQWRLIENTLPAIAAGRSRSYAGSFAGAHFRLIERMGATASWRCHGVPGR